MRAWRCVPIGLLLLACWLATSCRLLPPRVARNSPPGHLMASVRAVADVVEPRTPTDSTFHARFKIVEVEGISKKLLNQEIELALQPPDRLFLTATVEGKQFQLARNGQQLWVYAVAKKFCLVGEPNIPPFVSLTNSASAAAPTPRFAVSEAPLKPLNLSVSRFRLSYLPRYVNVTRLPNDPVGSNTRIRIVVTAKPEASKKRRLPEGRLELWLRPTDHLPQRISFANDHGLRLVVEAQHMDFEPPWPATRWAFSPGPDDETRIVARSHLTEFFASRWATLFKKNPSLGPTTGERVVLASTGEGRLELHDGTRVLFLKGSPEEMGRQHGTLLKKEIHRQMRDVLHGLGVGSSLAQGQWFFAEMETAQRHLLPHMDERYLREMDTLADAAGVSRAEMRMANLFPELFHCSGFALYGDATVDGRLYHGRLLDYFRGQGLEQNAVVMVMQPDYGYAWVNISYAGFVGSVTAMNEKRIAIGEIGGHGEGQWDGKPMAQLVREVMEQADTIDEAVELMRRSLRTCEYFYVISDGNARRAVGIRATPTEFETVWAGEPHTLIPEPIKDVVFVSGGSRRAALVERIKVGYGKFDAPAARELMKRPVAMTSNIHCALFAPETLDFWVANADSRNPASHTRFTHYNLAELLEHTPPQVAATVK